MYDYESLANFFSGAFINVHTEEISTFVIHKDRDEREELYNFLKSGIATIGYNSYDYDRHLTQFLLDKEKRITSMTAEEAAVLLKEKSTDLIENGNRPYIKRRELHIPDLDLMKMWHFNPGSARSTSLKKLQFAMRWERLQDMPLPHDHWVKSDEIDQILDYNINDILSTYEFYKKSDKAIDMRRKIYSIYNLNVFNKPDASIGQDIILEEVSKRTGISKWDLKEMRTPRPQIKLSECILPYIKFDHPELKKLLSELKSKVITETKGSLKYYIPYGGLVLAYGTGGLHAVPCTKKGSGKNPYKSKPLIKESNEDKILVLVDVR